MKNNLKLHMKDMSIVHYEVGNVRMCKFNPSKNVRPVCALLLTDKSETHKVKVIFKDDNAIYVDSYIFNRRLIGTTTSETVEILASIRELRKDCLVVDEPEIIKFNLQVTI